MKSSDILSTLSAGAQTRLDAVTVEQTAASAEVQGFSDYSVQLVADIKVETDAAYDLGVKDGSAAAGNPDGKIYTLDEANALIKESVDPLNAQIADLTSKLADLQAQYDALNASVVDVDAIKKEAAAAAIASFKADLSQKYADQQVAESTTETGFADLLK